MKKLILVIVFAMIYFSVSSQVTYPKATYKCVSRSFMSKNTYILIQYETYWVLEKYIFFKGGYELRDTFFLNEVIRYKNKAIVHTIDGKKILKQIDIYDKELCSMRLNGHYQQWNTKMKNEMHLSEHEFYKILNQVLKEIYKPNSDCYSNIYFFDKNYDLIKKEIMNRQN